MAQSNQGGLRSWSLVIVRFQVGNPSVVPLGTKTYPESKPPLSGEHGDANVDCVTVWLPGAPAYWKVITEPLVAVTDDGTNWSGPPAADVPWPTWICSRCEVGTR